MSLLLILVPSQHHVVGHSRRRLLQKCVAPPPLTAATTTLWKTMSTSSAMNQNNNNNDVDSWKNNKYPHLFQSLVLPNGITLPNRAIMGSMHTGLEGNSMPKWIERWISPDGEHDDNLLARMATYFQERAKGGVGLIVTGGIAPNYQGWTGPFSSQLTNQQEMEQHKVVTDAVHSVQIPVYHNGTTQPGRICLQILHTGRYAYHPFAVSASKSKSPISPFTANELSISGIKRTVNDFVNTSLLAQQAGYDGVEIMGSEGYLLSQFLSPRTNKRKDQYGGSLENRSRIVMDIIKNVRHATNPNFIIIFRLSLLDLVNDGIQFEESIELAIQLEQMGVTILNTGIGWHESRVPTIATSVPRGAFAFTTKQLKIRAGTDLTMPLITTNRINNPKTAENILSNNYEGADMVSMARPFLADPYLLYKSANNIENEINTCIGCNQACLDHAFVGKIASCLVNPRACHETELQPYILPIEQRLNIGVVGAGPAGCAFTIAAAQMGHHVTLYDKDTNIGGQFNMAKRIPGKEEFYETIRYFDTMLFNKYKYNIDVKLNTEISYDDMKGHQQHNKWIIATGVDPRNPKIPGQDHPNVLSYIDVLKHKKPYGKKVAVIGAGGIGFDVSEYVLHHKDDGKQEIHADDMNVQQFYKDWGIDVEMKNRGGLESPPQKNNDNHNNDRMIYLLQRKKGKLGAGLGKTTGWIHRATLNQSGCVEMINNVKYDKIDENGHLHILVGSKQERRILEVDNIIICAGQIEKQDLAIAANNAANKSDSEVMLAHNVYMIGGAYSAGELDAKRAIDMGTRLAYKIHDQKHVIPGKHIFQAKPSVEETFFKMIRKFM